MSKSLGNGIYLSDSKEEVKRKIMGMYTDPNHIHVEDPGNTKNNPVFTYLEAFSSEQDFKEFLPQYKNLDELKAHYEKGGLGDMVVKKFLLAVIENILEPIREKRNYYENRIDEVYKMLKDGSDKANIVANETLNQVKNAMKINYFEDKELIEKHIQKYQE